MIEDWLLPAKCKGNSGKKHTKDWSVGAGVLEGFLAVTDIEVVPSEADFVQNNMAMNDEEPTEREIAYFLAQLHDTKHEQATMLLQVIRFSAPPPARRSVRSRLTIHQAMSKWLFRTGIDLEGKLSLLQSLLELPQVSWPSASEILTNRKC
jgi:hypothetical protein